MNCSIIKVTMEPQGQGLDLQGRGQGQGLEPQGQGLTSLVAPPPQVNF